MRVQTATLPPLRTMRAISPIAGSIDRRWPRTPKLTAASASPSRRGRRSASAQTRRAPGCRRRARPRTRVQGRNRSPPDWVSIDGRSGGIRRFRILCPRFGRFPGGGRSRNGAFDGSPPRQGASPITRRGARSCDPRSAFPVFVVKRNLRFFLSCACPLAVSILCLHEKGGGPLMRSLTCEVPER